MEDLRTSIIALNIALMLLSILAMTARFSTRALIVKNFGTDDGWCCSCNGASKWYGIVIITQFSLQSHFCLAWPSRHSIFSVGHFSFDNFTSVFANAKPATRYGEGLHIEFLKPANVPIYTRILLSQGVSHPRPLCTWSISTNK